MFSMSSRLPGRQDSSEEENATQSDVLRKVSVLPIRTIILYDEGASLINDVQDDSDQRWRVVVCHLCAASIRNFRALVAVQDMPLGDFELVVLVKAVVTIVGVRAGIPCSASKTLSSQTGPDLRFPDLELGKFPFPIPDPAYT